MSSGLEPAAFALGHTIGAYRVIEPIGDGGMGVVYIAEHALIGRRVAVKVLRGEYGATPQLVERFFNEARITTAIRHPGIVEVFDFGYTDHGQPYIVMELLEGRSLAARLGSGEKPSLVEALTIARGIASALAAAHARGVVHRDLKPDNVFLVPDPDGGGDRVKLLDFGIAKLGHDPGGTRTRTGLILGTPQYMSPEQCRGASACDHRSDLYSLGCVLYEMIGGRAPFSGDFAEMLTGHLSGTPPPLHAPADVRDLVARLLAKDVARRPRSAALLGAELERLALHERARAVSLIARPRRTLWPFAVAAVLAIAVATLGVLHHRRASARPLEIAAPTPVVAPPPAPVPDAAVPASAPPDAAPPDVPAPVSAPVIVRRVRADAAVPVVEDDVTVDLQQAPGGGVDTPVP